MYKEHRRPRFHSPGIDNMLGDDPVFTAVSIYSLCGTHHISSQRRKRLPCNSFIIIIKVQVSLKELSHFVKHSIFHEEESFLRS
jgi:hypothetical protein